jgi:cytochrome c553
MSMKKVAAVCALGMLLASGWALADDAYPIIDGDPERGEELADTCIACHGAQGNSETSDWPNIAGQHASYTFKQLMDYQRGEERANAQMAGMVAGLDEQDMKDLAVYFEEQPHKVTGAGDDREALVERGQTIYMGGIPSKEVTACIACHGPNGKGNPAADYPIVGGQWAAYLRDQLHQYRDGERANDVNRMMRSLAEKMSDDEIEAVAEYMAGLN